MTIFVIKTAGKRFNLFWIPAHSKNKWPILLARCWCTVDFRILTSFQTEWWLPTRDWFVVSRSCISLCDCVIRDKLSLDLLNWLYFSKLARTGARKTYSVSFNKNLYLNESHWPKIACITFSPIEFGRRKNAHIARNNTEFTTEYLLERWPKLWHEFRDSWTSTSSQSQ